MMAAVVPTLVSRPRLRGFRLRQYYVSSIANASTIVTGVPGIVSVACRTGGGAAAVNDDYPGASGDYSAMTGLTGILSTARRATAVLTDASNGTITFYAPATATCILMIWSRA